MSPSPDKTYLTVGIRCWGGEWTYGQLCFALSAERAQHQLSIALQLEGRRKLGFASCFKLIARLGFRIFSFWSLKGRLFLCRGRGRVVSFARRRAHDEALGLFKSVLHPIKQLILGGLRLYVSKSC